MDLRVAIGAVRRGVKPRRYPRRPETPVKSRHPDVARIAEVSRALIEKHVAIDRPMRTVAHRAAFHPIAGVLEDERSLLVGMALEAVLLFETAEPFAGAHAVLVVAVGALNNPLDDAVPLIEVGLTADLLVALETSEWTAFVRDFS